MKWVHLLIVTLSLSACSTPYEIRHKEFDEVKVGMVKSQVLDVAGNPHWSDRHDGYDRWFYYMQPEARQEERVVYFKDGKVTLKGQRIKPLLTAEEEEEVKEPRVKTKTFKRSVSEKELKKIIKKAMKEEGKEVKENFEPL